MTTRREANVMLLAGAAAAAAPSMTASPRPAGRVTAAAYHGRKPLTETLKLRRSTREYSNRPL